MNTIKEDVCKLVSEVGAFIHKENGKVKLEQIEEKSFNSLVSYVDKSAEEMLVTGLQRIVPDAGFITEEDTVEQQQKQYTWIIDPLDGTTNFLHQIPHFSVSVALQQKDQIKVGVVYDVTKNEMFSAHEGGGSQLNGKTIRVSDTKEMKEAIVATGFPYELVNKPDDIFLFLKHWLKTARGIRRFGSAALDLAYVACGRFDMFYETTLNAWDVAAGALIVSEAGGKMSDFSGGNDYLFGQQIIASNPYLFNETVAYFQTMIKESLLDT